MPDRVESFDELHRALTPYRNCRRFWRGQASIAWPVMPRVGRPPFTGVDDRGVLESWKRRAIEHIPNPPRSDWDWLAIAQHHGLVTRLLDWSFNPLVAAFFAVAEQRDEDACIYAFWPSSSVDRETTPLELGDSRRQLGDLHLLCGNLRRERQEHSDDGLAALLVDRLRFAAFHAPGVRGARVEACLRPSTVSSVLR
jgi:hypothetical protein